MPRNGCRRIPELEDPWTAGATRRLPSNRSATGPARRLLGRAIGRFADGAIRTSIPRAERWTSGIEDRHPAWRPGYVREAARVGTDQSGHDEVGVHDEDLSVSSRRRTPGSARMLNAGGKLMRTRPIFSLLAALLFCSMAALAGGGGKTSTEPIEIGSRLEPFVDDYLIESMSGGLSLRMHRPRFSSSTPPGKDRAITTSPSSRMGTSTACITVACGPETCRPAARGGP